MIQDKEFMYFWSQCLAIATTLRQKEIMVDCQDVYYNHFLNGLAADEAMMEEWG